MNEIEKRIATVWPGCPTTADVEATRIADLRAIKAEIGAVAAWTDGMHARLDALAARVSALETASAKCPSAPMPHASPSPAASLVERMAETIRAAPTADDFEGDSIEWWTPVAQAALRVAAEELLSDVTGSDELSDTRMTTFMLGTINAVLRARLAAALEACR